MTLNVTPQDYLPKGPEYTTLVANSDYYCKRGTQISSTTLSGSNLSKQEFISTIFSGIVKRSNYDKLFSYWGRKNAFRNLFLRISEQVENRIEYRIKPPKEDVLSDASCYLASLQIGVLTYHNSSYFGQINNQGLREGLGIHATSTTTYFGLWSGDQKHGYGVYKHDNVIVEGVFIQGRFPINALGRIELLGLTYFGTLTINRFTKDSLTFTGEGQGQFLAKGKSIYNGQIRKGIGIEANKWPKGVIPNLIATTRKSEITSKELVDLTTDDNTSNSSTASSQQPSAARSPIVIDDADDSKYDLPMPSILDTAASLLPIPTSSAASVKKEKTK